MANEIIRFDRETEKWMQRHVGWETTLAMCEDCEMYYKPELGHKCLKRAKDARVIIEAECPICTYPITHCQCRYTGSAHPHRDMRRDVVLHNLHLLSRVQVEHIVRLQREMQIDYGDEVRQEVQRELFDNRNWWGEWE